MLILYCPASPRSAVSTDFPYLPFPISLRVNSEGTPDTDQFIVTTAPVILSALMSSVSSTSIYRISPATL